MIDVRVLILADDPLVRAGLAAILADQPGCQVVGQAEPPGDLGEVLDLYLPDVTLWDIGWDSEAALDHLQDVSGSGLQVLLLVPDEATAAEAWGTGFHSILFRNADSAKLSAAILAVGGGLTVLEPALADTISPHRSRAVKPPTGQLTPRELQVLQLLAEGLANKAIAHRLDISEHTVKFHVNSILTKLDSQSRTEAVAVASRSGLILL